MHAPKRHDPATKVQLTLRQDGGAEVILGFRYPVRRVQRLNDDLRVAMTVEEAKNLYHRLRRSLETHRKCRPSTPQAAQHGR